MKRVLLLITSLLAFTHLHADDYLLKGTIGKYPVVMNLYIRGNEGEATYFYTSSFLDIVLKGVVGDRGATFYAIHTNYTTNTDDTTETLQISEQADRSWKGKWHNKKGTQYDVMLNKLDVATIKHPYAGLQVVKEFKKTDEYNYVRSSMVAVIKDSLVKNGKYALQYYHLKNSEINLFDIVQGADKAVADQANILLQNKFMENVWNYCACTGADTPDYNYSIHSIFLTDNVLSVNIGVEYYCNQAAHPDFGDDPVTIDMKTGKEIVLPDILNLTTTAAPDPASEQWSDYQSKTYAPKLLALMKKMYPKYMAASDECDYSEQYHWEFPQWYITRQGLYIAPTFPHAQGPCRSPEWSYISFEELKKYKNARKHISLP